MPPRVDRVPFVCVSRLQNKGTANLLQYLLLLIAVRLLAYNIQGTAVHFAQFIRVQLALGAHIWIEDAYAARAIDLQKLAGNAINHLFAGFHWGRVNYIIKLLMVKSFMKKYYSFRLKKNYGGIKNFIGFAQAFMIYNFDTKKYMTLKLFIL